MATENLDPEIMRELNESMQNLGDGMREFTDVMTMMITGGADMSSAMRSATGATRGSETAMKSWNDRVREAAKAAELEAESKRKQAEQNANLKQAFKSMQDAAGGFTKALLDTSSGFQKYEASIKSTTGAVGSLLQNFGYMGKAVALATDAIGKLAGATLKQTDDIVKAYDSLAGIGGSVGLTAEEIVNLGKNAGFTIQTLEQFTKRAKESGTNLMAMGDSATGGIKAFSQVVAVGEDALKKYRRLGMTQEDLIEAQRTYIRQQIEGGQSLKKSPEQLQKASLAYIDQLNTLAELTGINVKKQQEAIDIANANENFNAYKFSMDQKALALEQEEQEARKLGQTARADELKAQAEQIRNTIAAKEEFAKLAVSTMSASNAAAALESISTDGTTIITENNQKLVLAGIDVVKMNEEMNKGRKQSAELLGSQVTAAKNFSNQFGVMAYGMGKASKDLQQTYGVDNEMRKTAIEFAKLETEEERKAFIARQAQAQKDLEAKGKEGVKGQEVMDATATKESLERRARSVYDAMIGAINPFRGKMLEASMVVVGLSAAAVAAASALNKIAKSRFGVGIDDLMDGKDSKGKSKPTAKPKSKKPLSGAAKASHEAKVARERAAKAKTIKSAGKFTVGGMIAGLGLDYGSEMAKEAGHEKTGAGLDIASSALSGASMGALLGSIVPVIGTAVGAAVGGALGGAYGAYQNRDAFFGDKKQEETQNKVEKKPLDVPKASEGGSFSGPKEGYLVELHGDEDVIPRKGRQPEELNTLGALNNTLSNALSAPKDYVKQATVDTTGIELAGDVAEKATEKVIAKLVPQLAVVSKVASSIDKLDSVQKIFSEKSSPIEKLWEVAKLLHPAARILGTAIDIVAPLIKDANNQTPVVAQTKKDTTVDTENIEKELPKAASGGIFKGPKSGYPVELHGEEMVVPLTGEKFDKLFEKNDSPLPRLELVKEAKSLEDFSTAVKDTDAVLKKYTSTLIKLRDLEDDELEKQEDKATSLDKSQDKLNNVFSEAVIDLARFTKQIKFATRQLPEAGTPLQTGYGGVVTSGSGAPVTSGVPAAEPSKTAPSAPVTTRPSPVSTTSDMAGYLKKVAVVESGGKAGAQAGTSSASGLFQFTAGTWKQMVKEMGKDYTLEDRFDPKKSEEVAAYFTSKQRAQLEKGTGQQATDTDMYMAHFLGAGGATKFLNALRQDPNAPATAGATEQQINANLSIFVTKDGRLRTLQEVYDLMAGKLEKAEQRIAQGKVSDSVKNIGGDQPTPQYAQVKKEELPKARDGGLFSGPMTGYPVELHGDELVAPLNADNIITKLINNTVTREPAVAETTTKVETTTAMSLEMMREIQTANSEMIAVLTEKLDSVIDKLASSNDIQDKILTYSRG